MVVGGVQGRACRRRDPGGVGAGLRLADLLGEHLRHEVGLGPHTLANLRTAPQTARQAGVDVEVLIGVHPARGFHLALADHRPGLHGGVDLVAGAVEEPGVDEHDTLRGLRDAGGEVHRRAALLVHDADLESVGRQAEELLDAAEQLGGERDLVGPVLLGLDDVDRPTAAVAALVALRDPVHARQRGDQRVEDPLGELVALGVQDRGVRHEMADVADEQHRAPVEADLPGAVRRGVDAVVVEDAGERLAALADLLGEVALHQAEPVAVAERLVLGVDSGDGVLEVHDRRDGGLEDHVLNPGRVRGPDGGVRVDLDVDVQSVVAQQHRGGAGGIPEVSHELLRVGQSGGRAVRERDPQRAVHDRVPGGPHVAAGGQRCRVVEELTSPLDHLVATDLVVGVALLGAIGLGDGVGAVEGVVERTPAGVARVDGEPRVGDRHHELRTGDGRDLRVDVLRGDRDRLGLGHEVTDLAEELLVRPLVDRRRVLVVPSVDLRLQVVPHREQLAVPGSQVGEDLGGTGPERVGVDPCARDRLGVDEVVEDLVDLDTADGDAFGHRCSPQVGDRSPDRL